MAEIQRVNIAQAGMLLTISKKTFYDAYAHLIAAADLEIYSATAFTLNKMQQELANPNSAFYFAVEGNQVVGYIKLNFNNAQTEPGHKNTLEVERIYVLARCQGKHIGSQLLQFAIKTAKNNNHEYVWLGVWEHNHPAIAFYEHKGFETFGSHPFLLGNDWQTDILMKYELSAA